MANPEHLEILKQGVEVWNRRRKENLEVKPNLTRAELRGANLRGANLSEVNLIGADLIGADLIGADLREANLREADLIGANLSEANLRGANLREADLSRAIFFLADLIGADLIGANLSEANLRKTNLSKADLSEVDLIGADLREANLCEANLRGADLHGANLRGANFIGANFIGADLIEADLIEVDLSRANLREVDLSEVDLSEADLSEANLRGADLRGANLSEVNLIGAYLIGADLREADLRKADLSRANLSEANLREVDLSEANLSEANLSRANLIGAYLETTDLSAADLTHASLESVDLRRCDMIDSNLDGAVLTGAKIWESKQSGWSIKGVICEYVCFDREGTVMTEFEPGEFEKLYSEQTKIVLHYEDGLTQFEVTTLPALIQFIESKHPGSSLRLRTIGEDAGGASVTVAVDELGDADVSVLQEDFENYKEHIREEVKHEEQTERIILQRNVDLLTGIIERNMGDTFNIKKLIGVAKADSSTVKQSINTNDLKDISELVSEILAARSEIEKVIPTEKVDELNAAFEVIEEQAKAPEKNWDKVKKGAQDVKKALDGVGETAGKWMPILEKLSDLL